MDVDILLGALKKFRGIDGGSAGKKARLLRRLQKISIQSAGSIIQYHDLLLFILVYPENKLIYRLAETGLNRLAKMVEKLVESDSLRYELSGSGIHATEQSVALSSDLVRWLLENYDDAVIGFFSDCTKAEASRVFADLVKPVELLQVKEEEKSLADWLLILFDEKEKKALRKLIAFFDEPDTNVFMKDSWYNQLKIYLTCKLVEPVSSRTFNRSGFQSIYFHKKLLKQIDLNAILQSALPGQKKLTRSEREQLTASSKWILSNLSRETDPSTYADVDATSYFELPRGYGVALLTMIPRRRLPIESYIGYLAFKNGIPIAYGGGWIFFHRCKFGINLLDAYRGGEAAYLFAQLMRVYHQHFQVENFIIEPYQFGKNNSEGLKSGAFWFYYRLGFRFMNDELNHIAQREYRKTVKDKNYRTPVSVLKSFTKDDLYLGMPDAPQEANPNLVSREVTRFIEIHFKGSRVKAYEDCSAKFYRSFQIGKKSMTVTAQSVWQQWSVLLSAFSLSIKQIDRNSFMEMLSEKAEGDERKFILLEQEQIEISNVFRESPAGFNQ